MRGKKPIFTVEPLSNFSHSFQVSVRFTYGTEVQPIKMTSTELAAVASARGTARWQYPTVTATGSPGIHQIPSSM